MDNTVWSRAFFFIMITFRYAAASHPGAIRDHNEDAHLASPSLLLVADGVGGHACGEVASALTVDAFNAMEQQADDTQRCWDAIQRANDSIAADVADNPDHTGMATTVTALRLRDDRLEIAHAGDSRAYLYRDDKFEQLTRDDSLIQDMLDAGTLSTEDAAIHPYRAVVTKAVQGEPIEPLLLEREAVVGDVYLVCSDGLSDVVNEAHIVEIMRAASDPIVAADALVTATLEAGAPDNVTVIIGEVVESAGGASD